MGCNDSKMPMDGINATSIEENKQKVENVIANGNMVMESVEAEVTEEDKENFRKDMAELFSRMDKDNSGSLELKEVILFMKALSDDLNEDHITVIFNNLDTDRSDSIDLDEFMISVAGWKPVDNTENNQINEVEVRQLFELIDTEKTGVINLKDARKAAELIKERFCIQEIEEWIKATDSNKDGVVSYEEFKDSLQKTISSFMPV